MSAGVPTKTYDVSMINIEITLNRWLDFYPGYMYVLTEDIDKVRAEETKNGKCATRKALILARSQPASRATLSSLWSSGRIRATASR